jgi:hypothetical protein
MAGHRLSESRARESNRLSRSENVVDTRDYSDDVGRRVNAQRGTIACTARVADELPGTR